MSESTSPRTTETPKDDAGREKRIRERLAAATPGPWDQYGTHVGSVAGYICAAAEPSGRYVPSDFRPVELNSERFAEAAANAHLIANAPSDLTFLLSVIDDLRDQLTHAASTFASNDEATCLTEAANRRGGETP